MKKDTVKIILTGGTIDSYFDSTKDTAVPLKHSALPQFIKSLKLNHEIKFTEVCMKDSRQLNKLDIQNVLKEINRGGSKRIIVTHGTYTMPDTARYLEANLKRKDQVIILTGSMIPLTGFAPSDAPFNLGFALASLNSLTPGVYVCMNGQIFLPSEVAKRLSEGKFVSVFGR